jgi:hypothetical protein
MGAYLDKRMSVREMKAYLVSWHGYEKDRGLARTSVFARERDMAASQDK